MKEVSCFHVIESWVDKREIYCENVEQRVKSMELAFGQYGFRIVRCRHLHIGHFDFVFVVVGYEVSIIKLKLFAHLRIDLLIN